ncbi:MAG: HAD family hydrolase [Candidatus Obscuribacterales bacterium]|nr:HAD family hydrolase [Candidatus Obscuribacterales bacterium]
MVELYTHGFSSGKGDLLCDTPLQKNFLEREIDVLGMGLLEGLGKAGATTVGDLGAGWQNLKTNPLEATGTFLKNHWHEAAVGAALTFVNPRRFANMALMAYSMRGVGYATYDAAVSAADPAADLAAVRNRYSTALGHEGTAFVSCLPMAMLGGMAGKAGANAVFGKNMGAADLLSGQVSLGQVKRNLWNICDTVNPPKVRLVISDLDNTMAPFNEYFARGIDKAVPEVAARTGIPELEIYRSVGQHMEKFRSFDYPWSLELALGERLNVGKPGGMSIADFNAKVSEPFWSAIDRALVEHHKPYAGVMDTLAKLKESNIPVAVLSDGSSFIALRRLTNLGADKFVERLVALKNWQEPAGLSSDLLAYGRNRVQQMLDAPHAMKEFVSIDGKFEKPNTAGFELILDRYKLRPSQARMVGDSKMKDCGVAHNAGSQSLWARYGHTAPADEAVLTRLRPLPEGSPKPAQPVPMLAAIDSFSQVLDHLNPKRDFNAMLGSTGRALFNRPQLRTGIVNLNFAESPEQVR